ncbi:MAG: hypothetical protein LBT48_01290 [Prevotellaceae bacterium]|jgi:tetratricopeptide (TPR) repeat protein|nr:hypothetical protein [Prevotellaceae bacterium]
MSQQKKKHQAKQPAAVAKSKLAAPVFKKGVPLPKWVYGVLLAVIFAFYGNTLFNHYALDDTMVITQNEFVKSGVRGIPKIFKHDSFLGRYGDVQINLPGGRYRPLSVAMLTVEYDLFTNDSTKQVINDKIAHGTNDDDAPLLVKTPLPVVNHLMNIVLYALTVFVLLLILLRLFPLEDVGGWRALCNVPVLIALLFIAHPLHSEVVANIKGRDEIMTLLGALGALYFTLKYLDTNKIDYLGFSFIAFLCGLFSKENAMTFLVVIPVTIYFFRQANVRFLLCALVSAVLVFPFFKGQAGLSFITVVPLLVCLLMSSQSKRNVKAMLPLYAAGVIFLLIRQSAINLEPLPETELMNNPFMYMTGGQKWASVLYVLGRYIWLQFFPYPLTTDYYPYHIPARGDIGDFVPTAATRYYPDSVSMMDFTNPWVILCVLLYVFLAIYTVRGIFRKDKYAYAVLWFAVPLSIVSNVFVQVGTFMNERFVFISSIGFCMALAFFLVHQLPKWVHSAPLYKGIVVGFLLLVLGLYGANTVARNKAWYDDFTLSTTDVKISPESAKANYDAARVYNIEFQKTTDSTARDSIIRIINNYAQRAVDIHPNYENALILLAWSNGVLSRPTDSSVKYLLRLVGWNPYNPAAYRHLWVATSHYGNDVARKISIWEWVAKYTADRKASNFETNYYLASLYAESQRYADAAPYFEKAANYKHDNRISAMMGAGAMYANSGQPVKGIEWFEEVVKLVPSDTTAWRNLRNVYTIVGDKAKAQSAQQRYESLKASMQPQ